MKMLGDLILVKPEYWPTQKQGRIVLPDTAKQSKNFARGKVIEIGPGLLFQTGERNTIDIEVGDHILFYKASGVEISVNDIPMLIVQEREVLAILEPGDFEEFTTGESTDGATD